MKKIVLLLLCISVFSLNQTVNAAVSSDVKKEAGYISLNDTVTKDVDPDMASITFAVENIGNSAQVASNENNTVSNNIINALKLVVNADTDTIKTNNFSVRPNYYTSSGKRIIKNYTAVNSVTVTTKDISKVAKLIDSAIANGANRTDNLCFGVENSKKLCNEMYSQLIKDLKSQAIELALAAGTSIDGLKHLNVSCNSDSVAANGRFYGKSLAFDSVAGEATVATPVEAGKAKVRVYVNADFYVK